MLSLPHLSSPNPSRFPDDTAQVLAIVNEYDAHAFVLRQPGHRFLYTGIGLPLLLIWIAGAHISMQNSNAVLEWICIGLMGLSMLLVCGLSGWCGRRFIRANYPFLTESLPYWWQLDWQSESWKTVMREARLESIAIALKGSVDRLKLGLFRLVCGLT